jgi:hypothetical protein
MNSFISVDIIRTYVSSGITKEIKTTRVNIERNACSIKNMIYTQNFPDKQVPVTTAWRLLRLLMNSIHIWRAAGSVVNKQSWTAANGCSFSRGVG